MGSFIAKALDMLAGKKERRIVLLGLDAAGKTTILYKLNMGEVVHTVPTIGFNVEIVKYKNIEFTCWDIGGQKKIRGLWHHYFDNTDAIIFVIDSNDPARIEEAKEELATVMTHGMMQDAALLVLANKQDLPQSMVPSVMMEKLGLPTKYRNRQWHIQGTVATSSAGLYEGLDWLADTLNNKPNVGARRQ